jgi:hypothetical protein
MEIKTLLLLIWESWLKNYKISITQSKSIIINKKISSLPIKEYGLSFYLLISIVTSIKFKDKKMKMIKFNLWNY